MHSRLKFSDAARGWYAEIYDQRDHLVKTTRTYRDMTQAMKAARDWIALLEAIHA